MLLIHPSYDYWLACGVAAHELRCPLHIAQIARANVWQRHRRSRLRASVVCELICDEIRLILAGSDEPPVSGRF